MCLDCDPNQLFCCFSNRQLGVKIIGFFYFVFHFLSLIWPIYELNDFRLQGQNENGSAFVELPIVQNGAYEQLLVVGIIFLLVGLIVSALLVWAAMQVNTPLGLRKFTAQKNDLCSLMQITLLKIF